MAAGAVSPVATSWGVTRDVGGLCPQARTVHARTLTVYVVNGCSPVAVHVTAVPAVLQAWCWVPDPLTDTITE